MKKLILAAIILFTVGKATALVTIENDRLYFDSKAQPAMLSAEVQYFRLRGGYARNIPREQVLARWNLVLDQARTAGAQMLTTYIPWDFHEYQAGHFDFDGTADEDGDGKPDYPSRDLNGFLKLVKQKGFRAVLVRPGPYISSEWGFLAIGAVPRWFYERCPECRSQTADGLPNRFMDVLNPKFLSATQKWFKALHKNVLRHWTGRDGLVKFVQLDNETNYMWQGLDRADHGPANTKRFQAYLRAKGFPDAVKAPVNQWIDPKLSGLFYDFMETQLRDYLSSLRRMWERLGLREKQILFTLGESFDGPRPQPTKGIEGILPHYVGHNESGMMTLNVYPLGGETSYDQILEHPFKIDHNAKAANSAKDMYLKSAQDYLMSTEIEGCNMWPKPRHPEAAMKQIYLSALGRGVKVMNLFYFHHGDNYEIEWFRDRLKPLFETLKKSSPKYTLTADEDLPDEFWDQLQKDVDQKIAVGFWALRETWLKQIPLFTPTNYANNLCFTPDYKPKPYFHDVIAHLGNDVINKNGDFLGASHDMDDPVCLVHDSGSHRPPASGTIDSVAANADGEPALFGYISLMGFNPRVLHADSSDTKRLRSCRLVLLQDLSTPNAKFRRELKDYVSQGGTAVAFIKSAIASDFGFKFEAADVGAGDVLGDPNLPATQTFTLKDSRCHGILNSMPGFAGFACEYDHGHFVQVSPPIYQQLATGYFTHLKNIPALSGFWRAQIQTKSLDLRPRVELNPGAESVIAWGRRLLDREDYWITVRSARLDGCETKIRVAEAKTAGEYSVTEVWSGKQEKISGQILREQGFAVRLDKFATQAFRITQLGAKVSARRPEERSQTARR